MGILRYFGAPWGYLEGILEHLGGILEASWKQLSRKSEKPFVFQWFLKDPGEHLGGILGASWSILEASWRHLEASWENLERK